MNLDYYNRQFRGIPPAEIISWALQLSNKRIVTTSFGKYSAVLLSTFQKIDPSIKVVWCDTGYNLPETEMSEFFETFSENIFQIEDYAQALEKSKFVEGIIFQLNLEKI